MKGEAIRYLAELPWVPQAFVGNAQLEWRELDDATVEVGTVVASSRVAVRLHFDAAGDIIAASAEVGWELPEGRFTYFRGRLTALATEE